MKRSLLLLGLVPVMAFGAVVKNPDANTLCWENANPVKFDEKGIDGWCVKGGLKATPVAGGLEIDSLSKKGSFEIMLPVSKDYPYIEFDLEILEKGKTFTLMSWMFPRGNPFYWSRDCESGYYVQDIYEHTKKIPAKGTMFYQFVCKDMHIRITNLRMVKVPRIHLLLDNNFYATRGVLCEDALLTATVKSSLKAVKPVELGFENVSRRIKLDFNDEPSWKLKPVAGKKGEYSDQTEVRSLSSLNIAPGKMMIEIKGFGKKAFTWLGQPWKASQSFVTDKPLSPKTDWIKDLRTDHPRIFVNKDTLPKFKAWAEKIGYKQILADAENFKVDPNAKKSKRRGFVGEKRPYSSRDVMIAPLYEEEALTCALAYLLTNNKKYADKAWTFLDQNLAVYKDCEKKRTAIAWYGIGRIQNMAALDWVWNSNIPRAKKYLKEFVDVNIKYARHGWWGPFAGVNGGSGRMSGFYGDSNTELYMGILAYKEGVCDDLAISMLKEGYKKYRECMNFRDTIAQDDGMLSSPTIGYSGGQYPWVSYDFLYLWRTAFKKPVKLPKLNHMQYFAEWFLWNKLPGKGKSGMRCYGFGDNARTNMILFSISAHLYNILGAYGAQYPEEAGRIAEAIAITDGRYNRDFFKEKGRIQKRAKAPKYYWGFYRRFLAYDAENVKLPDSKAKRKTANARHFPTGGLVFMRSGSGNDDTYALFTSGMLAVSHDNRGDENHFTIFKKGYLAIDAGYRYDAWYGAIKYHNGSVAHNTMLIHDPSERFPEDAANCESVYKRNYYLYKDTKEQDILYKQHKPHFADADGGQNKKKGGKCRAFSTNDFYSYVVGDATKTYSAKKCKEFNRQFIHIQPDVFLVFDRVESTNATFKKEWLLHFLEEPVIKGNVTTAKVTDEGGIIRCTSLLPKGGVITKIGGPGKEYMGTHVNWTAPKKVLRKVRYAGKWRINLSPAKAAKRDYFLNVIDVGKNPVKNIRLKEDAKSATVTFTTAQGRKVSATFLKDDAPGGKIRIEEKGKVLCNEALTQKIQPQAGFLY